MYSKECFWCTKVGSIDYYCSDNHCSLTSHRVGFNDWPKEMGIVAVLFP